MRPTWRTVGVVGVAVGSILMAAASGARALNALAAPALIALLVSAVQVFYAGRPEIDRGDPVPGHPGESRTVELTVDGGALARVTDSIPPGVAADGYDRRVTLPATVEYEIELGARGAWDLGPPRVVVTDVLGLFVRAFEPEGTATALVYPPLVDLREDDAVAHLLGYDTATDRQAFDTIREYAPGDPLRDVHWKSSAKRSDGDLVVKQFVSEQRESTLTIAAGAATGHDDAMASAAASLAVLAMEAGLSVGVTCPAGEVATGRGQAHRQHVLDLLARTGPGQPARPAREGADVILTADADGVTATIDGQDHRLSLGPTPPESPAGDGERARGAVSAGGASGDDPIEDAPAEQEVSR
ncbi:Uncharacterized conserved protein, DUF58 family, contains vWF domain [Halorientalis persicus]|uniref:Uncharacterized conserved protein, DUF58 family, contains vWF domain n=1 Tax=Halorientalis persicus TaxID=1367881 RepID=A0A1H8P344_9EURY|nr:DUF58 domain-containing protein [Halorientalis persicus]SEO36038.1 Uncharacterized conserved protein, DUF58 family, contains vWF domain [Halorientalis persicus]